VIKLNEHKSLSVNRSIGSKITLFFVIANLLVFTSQLFVITPKDTYIQPQSLNEDPLFSYPIGFYKRWLIDADGRVIIFHGISEVNKVAPYYPLADGFSDQDAAWLAENGFYAVRLGVLFTGLMPSPGVISTSYLNELAATVNDLGRHHILVLLDFHQDDYGPSFIDSDGFPTWMTLTDGVSNIPSGFPLQYGKNPGLQQAFQSFWNDQAGPEGIGLEDYYLKGLGAVARIFGKDPWILGYEFINEPWPGIYWIPCAVGNGCPNLDESELSNFYAKAISQVRVYDKTHLAFGEPFSLFNLGFVQTHVMFPAGASAGLAFHDYPVSNGAFPNPPENAISWAQNNSLPIINTEFGGSTDYSQISYESSIMDSEMIPWMYWDFTSLLKNASVPPRFSNVNQSVFQSLVQAYALSISGTPITNYYDVTTKTLKFVYSTTSPNGHNFAAGSLTTFVVPQELYPQGYSVSVIGGTFSSVGCSPLATVASNSGAPQIEVTIRPSNSCP
jgi:endoglycosylceramidase